MADDLMEMLFMRQGCGGCGASAPIWTDTCPRCGMILHSARSLRAAGVLYLALGLILTAPAVYLLVLFTGMVFYPSDSGRYTGGVAGLVVGYCALGFVLAVGVTGLLMGAWQVVYGRRNLKLVRVVIALYLFFWASAVLVWALG